jgi:hypothetical protein
MMKRMILEAISHEYMLNWAASNGWKILSCSSKPSPYKEIYAKSQGGIVVPDPRGGHVGNVLVVKVI